MFSVSVQVAATGCGKIENSLGDVEALPTLVHLDYIGAMRLTYILDNQAACLQLWGLPDILCAFRLAFRNKHR